MDEIRGERSVVPAEKLLTAAIDKYYKNDAYPLAVRQTSRAEKLKNEVQLSLVLSHLQKEIKPYLKQLREIDHQKIENHTQSMRLFQEVETLLIDSIQEIGDKKLLFDHAIARFFIDNDYIGGTIRFIHEILKNDPLLSGEEIFQGVHNFWIMHSFQVFWDLPISLTPSVYAFSLLYPYTDNIVDSTEIAPEEKSLFNERLSHFLDGYSVNAASASEERIYALLAAIDKEYPRASNHAIVESIKLIQKAQIASLKQNQGRLSDEEILKISFFKGGATLVADNYLVKGHLTEEETHYSFQSGTFLQLLDDLSDVEEDRANGSRTIYTQKTGYLDKEIQHLISYIFRLNESSPHDTESQRVTRQAMKSSTLLMLMTIIGQSPELVSQKLYEELEAYSNVRLKYYDFVFKSIEKTLTD